MMMASFFCSDMTRSIIYFDRLDMSTYLSPGNENYTEIRRRITGVRPRCPLKMEDCSETIQHHCGLHTVKTLYG